MTAIKMCEHGNCKVAPETHRQSLFTNSVGVYCAKHLADHPDQLPEVKPAAETVGGVL